MFLTMCAALGFAGVGDSRLKRHRYRRRCVLGLCFAGQGTSWQPEQLEVRMMPTTFTSLPAPLTADFSVQVGQVVHDHDDGQDKILLAFDAAGALLPIGTTLSSGTQFRAFALPGIGQTNNWADGPTIRVEPRDDGGANVIITTTNPPSTTIVVMPPDPETPILVIVITGTGLNTKIKIHAFPPSSGT